MADKDKDKIPAQESPVQENTVEVNDDVVSDTADNNHSLNKPDTIEPLSAKFLRATRFGAYGYPTYRFEKGFSGKQQLSVGDKLTFTVSDREHTGEVQALTDKPTDIVFCNVCVT